MRSGLFELQRLENSAFPVSSLKALPRNLSCTPDITTGALGGRLNTSRFSSLNIQHFPACKGDPSAALGMTVRGSSLSVSLATSHSSLIPAFKFLGLEDSAFPVSSFRAQSRNLSCTPDITTGVLGGRLNTSRFSSSNIRHFPVCKGDPSAALGMTVRGSSLSVSLVTSHLSLIPAFKFRGSGTMGTTNLLAEVCHIINAEEFFPTPCDEENLAFDDLE